MFIMKCVYYEFSVTVLGQMFGKFGIILGGNRREYLKMSFFKIMFKNIENKIEVTI